MKTSAILPFLIGSACALALVIIGLNSLETSREHKLKDLVREAGLKIQNMRLQANARALDDMSGELRQHQRALKALKESRRQGSQRAAASTLIAS